MAAQLVTRINRYIGTAAEIAAMTLTDIPTGSTFFESDTGILKILNAAGALVEAPSESVQLSGSNALGAVAVTPIDTVDLATVPTKGLYVGVAGNVKVDMADGTTVTFTALSSGMIHPISCKRVYDAGTTATSILAVY